jgi:predicted ATPase
MFPRKAERREDRFQQLVQLVTVLRFKIENFRSFRASQELSFESKFLIVTGRNNSGKTNVLRAFASIFNRFDSREFSAFDEWLFDKANRKFLFSLFVDADAMSQQRVWRNAVVQGIFRHTPLLEVPFFVDGQQVAIDAPRLAQVLSSFIPHGFEEEIARSTFTSWYQSRQENLIHIASDFNVLHKFQIGTIYVPSFRHITLPDVALQSFVPASIPGNIISFHNIVGTLQNLDRPAPSSLSDKERLLKIEAFLSFCLEKDVKIEVAHDRSAVYIIQDNIVRNLNSLGTGIEQLLIIGTASIGFENSMILLEEPELHLHPRAQRRMLAYFDEHSRNRFVISTHSSAIIDAEKSDVVHIVNDGVESFISSVKVKQDRYGLIDDLGYRPSDIVQSNFIVWVEGPSDRIYVNYWIKRTDSKLIEGVDYSILFYGGRLLSHITFSDEDEKFIRIMDVNRHAAIIIDSDKRGANGRINKTKSRIKKECEERRIFVWITAGREIENYIHEDDIRELSAEFESVDPKASPYERVLDAEKTNKVSFAISATSRDLNMSNLDLSAQIAKLVTRIRAVKE